MNYAEARKQLKALGFTFPKDARCTDGTIRWGRKAPEPFNTGKNHFEPTFRDVFIAPCQGGYYVTSHIHGQMRRYRCRYWNETTIVNIFGGGKTLSEAVTKFVDNFKSKTYNVNPI